MRNPWLLLLPLLASCTNPLADPPCEWDEPVIVTGVAGYLGENPVTEILLLAPDTCDTLDRQWMLWEGDAQRATLPEVPPDGTVDGGGLAVTGPTLIDFDRTGIHLELRYPDPETPGDVVTLAWFATSMTDLALVDCAANGASLECSVRTP